MQIRSFSRLLDKFAELAKKETDRVMKFKSDSIEQDRYIIYISFT